MKGPFEEISAKEVEEAVSIRMKSGKAAGPTEVTSDLFRGSRKGRRKRAFTINKVLDGEAVPEDWRCNTTMPIYKGTTQQIQSSAAIRTFI